MSLDTKQNSGKSKAAQIRKQLSQGITKTSVIAQQVGCAPAYVRATKQRLRHGGTIPAEKAWREKNADALRAYHNDYQNARYRNDPEFRARKLAVSNAWNARKRAEREAAQ